MQVAGGRWWYAGGSDGGVHAWRLDQLAANGGALYITCATHTWCYILYHRRCCAHAQVAVTAVCMP
jgi:hypothetical protein